MADKNDSAKSMKPKGSEAGVEPEEGGTQKMKPLVKNMEGGQYNRRRKLLQRGYQKKANGLEKCMEKACRMLNFLSAVEILQVAPRVVVSATVVASVSQRKQDEESNGEESGIDVELLINLVHARQPLWDVEDHHHTDAVLTQRLWEEVAAELIDGWEDLKARTKKKSLTSVTARWWSVCDGFRRDYNKEMQAPSGSAGRKSSQYRYARALVFLKTTMMPRRSFANNMEPASVRHPPGVIPEETVTGDPSNRPCDPSTSAPSLPSTSTSDPSLPPLLLIPPSLPPLPLMPHALPCLLSNLTLPNSILTDLLT
ncbi:uncharacterized protein ACNLHF_022709 [Anomaloglossus baeobatrachus]